MQDDDTLIEVFPLLRNPEAYVSGIIVQMNECASQHKTAYLRLGVTGVGAYPCYRVAYRLDPLTDAEVVYGSYYDSHKPFQPPYDKVTPGRWSTRSMGLHEVIAFAESKNI